MTGMKDLFELGLRCETGLIERVDLGYAAFEQLMHDIGETETECLARMYCTELKRLAGSLPGQFPNSGASSIPLVDGLMDLARKLEVSPGYVHRVVPPDRANVFRGRRIKLIRHGILNNIPIPKAILDQYPTDFFAADFQCRSRADKAAFTARANQIGSEDYTLYDRYGVRLRRQDGRTLKAEEISQIQTGLDEIFMVLGDLSPLTRKTSLTIIHTSGKRIFQHGKTSYGGFFRSHNSIAVGVREASGSPGIKSLAHELIGHWLDHISVPSESHLERLIGADKNFRRINLSTSVMDAYLSGEGSILARAVSTMNTVWNTEKRLDYKLVMPTELFARIAEQYLSIKLFKENNRKPASVQAISYYMDCPGFWDIDQWEAWLYDAAFRQIEARLELAFKAIELPSEDSPAGLLHPITLPWSSII